MYYEVERRSASGANRTSVEQSLYATVKREVGNVFVRVEYAPDVDAKGEAQPFGVVIASVERAEVAEAYLQRKAAALAANLDRLGQ